MNSCVAGIFPRHFTPFGGAASGWSGQRRYAEAGADGLASELIRKHGRAGGERVLAGAEQVMREVQSLPPSVQPAVLELLFQVFNQAQGPQRLHAARRPASQPW